MRYLATLFVFTVLLASCDSGNAQDDDEASTWDVIQTRILGPKCTEACHTAGSALAIQSGLVLTSDVAYDQLAGVVPTNAAAKAAGLLRVHTSAGTDIHASFFWEKINAPQQDHLFKEHSEFGALMPLGDGPLTFGELGLIRRWLLAGAPETGVVADAVVLEDTSVYREYFFEPLPLLAPSEGLSLRLGPFEVQPNFEREFFYRDPAETTERVLVDRVTMSMTTGSHHLILYTFSDAAPSLPLVGQIRDLRRDNGSLNTNVLRQMQYHVFLSGTQWPIMDYRFPPGVALELDPGTSFDINPHYINRTDETRDGEIHINLQYANPASIQRKAKVLNLNNLDLVLPPKRVTTVTKSFTMSERVQVFQLFSHAHQHMIEFRVELEGGPRDGEVVYRALDWEHPPILELDPPLEINAGDAIRLVATYNNTTDQILGFGFRSEDEMMILFGYYY